METVRWDELIPDEQWDSEPRSDIDFEKKRKNAAMRTQTKNPA